jgi:hypothetical protein
MTAPALRKKQRRRKGSTRVNRQPYRSGRTLLAAVLLFGALVASVAVGLLLDRYAFSLQWPLRIHLQSPLVISLRSPREEAAAAQADQNGRHLTAYQQYACLKFGSACRVALAIQRAENPKGACEIYHYNSDGTLDWGYFQINTVHLQRPGLNLRDLLDCKANIDFAYLLYQERGFVPWTTYNSGAYVRFLHDAR